jgi:hypothetical protein
MPTPQLRRERLAMQRGVARVPEQLVSQTDRQRARVDGDISLIKEPVYIPSQQQATVLVMLANRCVAVQMRRFQRSDRTRPGEGAYRPLRCEKAFPEPSLTNANADPRLAVPSWARLHPRRRLIQERRAPSSANPAQCLSKCLPPE